jgi:hypothetical protein
MPSTPESNLRLELQATGENATTWGTKTNTNLDLLSQAIAGAANVNVGGSGNYTLVASNYTSDEARAATLVLTGTLTGNRDVIVPTSPKHYTVLNQTSGAFTLTIRQSAGTGLVIPAGTSQIICTSTTCVDAIGATPFTKTLLDDANAAAARATLGIPDLPATPALPQNAAGVGQVVTINPAVGSNYTLPAGGTWLTWRTQYSDTGVYAFTHAFGVLNGGTSLGTPAPGYVWVGWAWRIT